MDTLVSLLALVTGFAILGKSANALVDGGATLARQWGVEAWIVGLTIVAWGTSMPEVVVSGLASWGGEPGKALGNVLGSNVANAGLVLGSCALILPAVLAGRVGVVDTIAFLGSLGYLTWCLRDGVVDRFEAGVMLALFIVYTVSIFRRPREQVTEEETSEELEEAHTVDRPWLYVIVGSVFIAVGAQLVMIGGEGLAERFGLSDGVVGLLIFALGTSLPELAAGISAARKGHEDIGLGNVVGSNVFNTFAVVGVAALVRPFGPVSDEAWSAEVENGFAMDIPVNFGFAIALLVVPRLVPASMRRGAGGVLLASYLTYMFVVVTAR